MKPPGAAPNTFPFVLKTLPISVHSRIDHFSVTLKTLTKTCSPALIGFVTERRLRLLRSQGLVTVQAVVGRPFPGCARYTLKWFSAYIRRKKMGLDMFAFKTKQAVSGVDFKTPEDAEQIAYWRKHPNLHGWMEALYGLKLGTTELAWTRFNCTNLALDAADIDALEHAIKNASLPETQGFFFGVTRPEEVADDIQFIEDARAALRDGYYVYYTSWW
jgi:hypothetical protein